jgi:hypothetical protein|tara:strand:- start:570 stop:815 length:246 start_codon:yes stop_codon:yes gene_type:complete
MKGTVTISLEDYDSLKNLESTTKNLVESNKTAAKELQVFLSFLCSRTSIIPFVEEFNRQSTASKIVIENNRAKIELKNDKN